MERAALLALLAETPGLTPTSAARALGVSRSTALYHMRRLLREGAVLAEGHARRPRYFANGSLGAHERARVLAGGHDALLQAVRASQGATKTELSRSVAIARTTLTWRLRRLHRAGLVRFVKEGRSVRVYAEEALS